MTSQHARDSSFDSYFELDRVWFPLCLSFWVNRPQSAVLLCHLQFDPFEAAETILFETTSLCLLFSWVCVWLSARTRQWHVLFSRLGDQYRWPWITVKRIFGTALFLATSAREVLWCFGAFFLLVAGRVFDGRLRAVFFSKILKIQCVRNSAKATALEDRWRCIVDTAEHDYLSKQHKSCFIGVYIKFRVYRMLHRIALAGRKCKWTDCIMHSGRQCFIVKWDARLGA